MGIDVGEVEQVLMRLVEILFFCIGMDTLGDASERVAGFCCTLGGETLVDCCTVAGSLERETGSWSARFKMVANLSKAFCVSSPASRDIVVVERGVVKIVMMSVAA